MKQMEKTVPTSAPLGSAQPIRVQGQTTELVQVRHGPWVNSLPCCGCFCFHRYQFDAQNFDTAAVKGRVEMSCRFKHGRQVKIHSTKKS